VRHRADARARECRADPLVTAVPEGPDLGRVVDLRRAGLARELGQLALRSAPSDEQRTAPLPERLVQIGEALEQEACSDRRPVAAVQQSVVEAEYGRDFVVRRERLQEGRVVVDAEVASEPDDCGHVAAPTEPNSLPTTSRR
jgi:hypothetical protein